MKFDKSMIGNLIALFVWSILMGVTAISMGVGALFPPINSIAKPLACPTGQFSYNQNVSNPFRELLTPLPYGLARIHRQAHRQRLMRSVWACMLVPFTACCSSSWCSRSGINILFPVKRKKQPTRTGSVSGMRSLDAKASVLNVTT